VTYCIINEVLFGYIMHIQTFLIMNYVGLIIFYFTKEYIFLTIIAMG